MQIPAHPLIVIDHATALPPRDGHEYDCSAICIVAGADPGFRRGGGGFVHSEGGFRTGISGADPNCCRVLGKSTSKKKLQTAVGGVSDHPKKPLYPRMSGDVESITTTTINSTYLVNKYLITDTY